MQQLELKAMQYIVYSTEDQRQEIYVFYTQFCPLEPGFIQFKPGLTHWTVLN